MNRVHWLASPHFNHRPPSAAIDLIVLHAISLPPGVFEQQPIDMFFTGQLDAASYPDLAELEGVRVSAHFVVNRDGRVTQYVACSERAWHAGVSSWQGRDDCNDYAIGIEMIGDETHPFTRAQYRACARLCHTLMHRFPAIDHTRIVGHQDIAPGRKWDPGKQCSWQHFHRILAHIKHPYQEIQ
ncbi:MAG: 1,6-anhydro-N-acetylmuramyl-L-alanine amidase AmpD [Mariprofundaceae bacterium]